jgi:chitodextrinase
VPLDVIAEAESDSKMSVIWSPSTDNVGVEGYRVFRDGSAVGVAAATLFIDTGLAAGTGYGYQVSAFDSTGNESARSAAAYGVTEGGTSVGDTYLVGPTRTYANIGQVEALLEPGDLVLVDGDEVYAGGVTFSGTGTPEAPITIRGVKINGSRPVIEGGYNVVELNRSNYVFEGFEIRGAEFRGLYHHADNIVIRDCVVHDCPHGILGADTGSGDLTVEYCEIYGCGEGTGRHQIYMATNENDYPGSVFRLQFCYIHDGTGGENVKSRAERSEIYYNWLESPYYHNLELIGPDPAGGVAEGTAREDADVVGNVLIARRFGRNVRVGGDGTGQGLGRYRFVNNTFIHLNDSPDSHIFPHFGVESVEMHNNLFYIVSGTVLDDSEADWVYGRRVGGANNWVHSGARYPDEWTSTITGTNPGLTNLAAGLFRPAPGSVLVDAGISSTVSPAGSPFLFPLALPGYHPPEGTFIMPGNGETRPVSGAVDIGAFELR